ncbi:MAG: alpha/beta fold hydrolase, partial [Acidimicrobiales bacterium]
MATCEGHLAQTRRTRQRRPRSAASLAVVVAVVAALVGSLGLLPGNARAATNNDPLLSSPLLRPCHPSGRALCGQLTVPWYWGVPNDGGGTFTVRFAVFPHTDQAAPALEPIVAMQGGPGYGSIPSAPTYLFMLGNLHARHDLIVMDQRGTGGSDPISCPGLQSYDGLSHPRDYAAVTAACAKKLGPKANAYGSAAVGDDLAAILARLHVRKLDVYGDSYGSYAAQVFAFQHPSLVRTLVLDGTFSQRFNPLEPEASVALRRSWNAMCAHFPGCHGTELLRSIASFSRRLAARPIVASAYDSSGDRQHLDLIAPAFAQLVFDATYSYTFFRDLPAALAAATEGDLVPIERLAADDASFNAAGGSPSGYSAGDLQAVSCHDYPTAWNIDASFRTRAAQLATAVERLPADAFYPFSKSVWLSSLDENELVYGCLDWPRPAVPAPPFPKGVAFPHVPVLVL